MDALPTTAPPEAAEPRVLARVTLAAAVLAIVAFAGAAVLLALPVETPAVQDCGTPGAYIYDGRVDVVPDAEGRIRDAAGEVVTLDADVAAEARRQPCQDRVADRAVPAGLLLVAALVVGGAALAVETAVVRPRVRRARAHGPHL